MMNNGLIESEIILLLRYSDGPESADQFSDVSVISGGIYLGDLDRG